MTIRIAWYVHHHGRGHLSRLLAVAPHLDAEVSCFSSLPRPADLPGNCSWTVLARDDDHPPGAPHPLSSDPTAGGLLHWSPVGHAGHRGRLAAIAAVIDADPVAAFVVDVSVEVTLFARLLGVPTIVIAQPGIRTDEAHRIGYRAAAIIIAPWPRSLLAPAHLEPVRDRVVFTGDQQVRWPGEAVDTAGGRSPVERRGRVGGDISRGRLRRGCDARQSVVGSRGSSASTWVADPWPALIDADVVVSWAGQNSIADLAAAGAAAIVIPQARPFDEQVQTAQALSRAGLAVVEREWPEPPRWEALLDVARRLRPDWDRWETCGAARRAADAISGVARGAA